MVEQKIQKQVKQLGKEWSTSDSHISVTPSSKALLSKYPNGDETIQKFRFLLSRFGLDQSAIKRAYALSCPILLQDFENNIVKMNTQHRTDPQHFKKNDWSDGHTDETLQRYKFWHSLQQKMNIYDEDGSHLVCFFPLFYTLLSIN